MEPNPDSSALRRSVPETRPGRAALRAVVGDRDHAVEPSAGLCDPDKYRRRYGASRTTIRRALKAGGVAAAVVGIPHEMKGQGIAAFVTLERGRAPNDAMKKELIAWVRKQIGALATPDQIQFSPGLPKTRSGKIMRRILRKIAEDDFGNLGDTSTLADPAVVDDLVNNRQNKKAAKAVKERKHTARVYERFPIKYWDRWLDEKRAHLFVRRSRGLDRIGGRTEQPGGLVGGESRDPRVRVRTGGVQVDGGDAEHLLDRARGDVDELHPAVRHDDEPPEQPAVPDEQVMTCLSGQTSRNRSVSFARSL